MSWQLHQQVLFLFMLHLLKVLKVLGHLLRILIFFWYAVKAVCFFLLYNWCKHYRDEEKGIFYGDKWYVFSVSW